MSTHIGFKMTMSHFKSSKDSSCRMKNSCTDLCPRCNVTHVPHIILICIHLGVQAKRDSFLAWYTKHVKSFDVKTSSSNIREILILDPSCVADCKEPAKISICAVIDQVHLCECEFDVRLKNQIGDMNVFLYIKQ